MKADAGGPSWPWYAAGRAPRLRLPLEDNWFACQAFGRRYPEDGAALPPTAAESFEAVRARAGRVEPHHATVPTSCRPYPRAWTPTSSSTPRTG